MISGIARSALRVVVLSLLGFMATGAAMAQVQTAKLRIDGLT